MPVIRTPEERFGHLPGYPWLPRYVNFNGLRMHYVDEGGGEVVLCLHGEPTWSYLYRKIIAPLSDDYRVLAPDFIGFGRSDKFTEIGEYSFRMHYDSLSHFIDALDLSDITLVVQDWGGLLGLTLATDRPDRFARLVIMNTFLPIGQEPMSEAFLRWRRFALSREDLPIGNIVRKGTVTDVDIPDDVIEAYEAPFPDVRYKAGAAAFPRLVPMQPEDPGAAEMRKARERLAAWTKPAQVMFSDRDLIMRGCDRFFRRLIPSANDQPEIVIRDAGHFLQEDQGERIAQEIDAFIRRAP